MSGSGVASVLWSVFRGSVFRGSRLPATVALTVATTAIGLTIVKDAEASTPPAAYLAPAAAVSPTPSSSTVPRPEPSPLPPNAPTGLVATAVTATSVTLTWTASTRGCCDITGYDITYTRAYDDVFRAMSVGNVTTATVTTGISPASEYTFWVSALDGVGRRSGQSNAVKVVTPASDTGPDTVAPTAPADLRIVGMTQTAATLGWSPSTDNVGVTGYNVYSFDGWFASTLLATVTGTTYAVPASRGLYYVRARDAAGNVSLSSGTITVNAPTPPPVSPSAGTPPRPACRVVYKNTSEWPDGFVADVTITNTGSAAINGWKLAFAFGADQKITNSWNSSFTQVGASVTMTNVSWNGTLAPGASTTTGMYGTRRSANLPPTAFTLNGAPCTVG